LLQLTKGYCSNNQMLQAPPGLEHMHYVGPCDYPFHGFPPGLEHVFSGRPRAKRNMILRLSLDEDLTPDISSAVTPCTLMEHALKTMSKPPQMSSPMSSQVPMCDSVQSSSLFRNTGKSASENTFHGRGASAVPLLTAITKGGRDACKHRQHQLCKMKSPHAKSKKTLLVAYLPRCSDGTDVQHAFVLAGMVAPFWANVIHEKNGASKCFGFVKFSTHDAAMAALEACQTGKVTIEDNANKAWYVKASWAQAERRKDKK